MLDSDSGINSRRNHSIFAVIGIKNIKIGIRFVTKAGISIGIGIDTFSSVMESELTANFPAGIGIRIDLALSWNWNQSIRTLNRVRKTTCKLESRIKQNFMLELVL